MEAPDKVFFPNDINLLTKLSLLIKQKGDIEYIRKDLVYETVKTAEDHAYFAGREKLRETLLEWAKEYKRVIETHGDERDAYLRGEYSALKFLIDKIESL